MLKKKNTHTHTKRAGRETNTRTFFIVSTLLIIFQDNHELLLSVSSRKNLFLKSHDRHFKSCLKPFPEAKATHTQIGHMTDIFRPGNYAQGSQVGFDFPSRVLPVPGLASTCNQTKSLHGPDTFASFLSPSRKLLGSLTMR